MMQIDGATEYLIQYIQGGEGRERRAGGGRGKGREGREKEGGKDEGKEARGRKAHSISHLESKDALANSN